MFSSLVKCSPRYLADWDDQDLTVCIYGSI